MIFKGKPLNFKSVLIYFGEAIHGICIESIPYLIEVSRFWKETYWIWKSNPYYLVAIPFKLNRNPLVLEEIHWIEQGNPFICKGNPYIVSGSTLVCNENPLLWKGNPLIFKGTCWFENGNFLTTFHNISIRRAFRVFLPRNFPQRIILTLC